MKRSFSIFSILAPLMIILSSFTYAETAAVIDAKADAALTQFKKQVIGADQFLSKVEGYLIFPSVVKGGFVVGGEYGEGVLRVKGKSRAYYNILAGSVGFQMGLQQTSYIIAFADERTMENFMKSDGWEAGVDGAVTVVKWGAGKDISSISYEKPIYAIVFNGKGLMYNLTMKGTKFTRITPEQ